MGGLHELLRAALAPVVLTAPQRCSSTGSQFHGLPRGTRLWVVRCLREPSDTAPVNTSLQCAETDIDTGGLFTRTQSRRCHTDWMEPGAWSTGGLLVVSPAQGNFQKRGELEEIQHANCLIL